MARTPGPQGIFTSELLGVYLASQSSPPNSTIFLDNHGASLVLSSQKKVVRHSFLVSLARASLVEKHQTVKWIKGHAGHRGNELADFYARKACSLPAQKLLQPHSPFSVVIEGLPHMPPHKCWTEENVPKHRHAGIHAISFVPLKRSPDSLPWIKWLFGLCWRPGWASYQSFWSQTASRQPCPSCHRFHNASINGTLAFCCTHPLRHAWLQAWNQHPLIIEWLSTADMSDQMLTGKVCIPDSLYRWLSSHLGRTATRKLIQSFQKDILSLLHNCLDALPQPPVQSIPKGNCKRIWVESDWDTPGQGVPHLGPRRARRNTNTGASVPEPRPPQTPPAQHQPSIASLLRLFPRALPSTPASQNTQTN